MDLLSQGYYPFVDTRTMPMVMSENSDNQLFIVTSISLFRKIQIYLISLE